MDLKIWNATGPQPQFSEDVAGGRGGGGWVGSQSHSRKSSGLGV